MNDTNPLNNNTVAQGSPLPDNIQAPVDNVTQSGQNATSPTAQTGPNEQNKAVNIDHQQLNNDDKDLHKTEEVLEGNAVTKRDVENVVSSWTGIPISKLTEDESAKLLVLEKRIHKRLIDQEEAVLKVAEAVRRGRIGLASGQRPIASFIFLGPSGTGKTELAKTLAEILFGRDDAMIRLDMSEYMEKHEVAKLIGAPPGYVGYEEGGQLTEAVRAKPYSIVLLDEVEKAHPDVFNILLQLLEDGRLTDNKGNTISFKNTIVICTSNIGSALITEKLKDSDTKTQKTASEYAKEFAELSSVVNNELRKFFRPELLNRYDDIVIFKPLRREDMVGIAKLGIEKTAKLLKEQGYTVSITDRALEKLAREGYDPMYGARPLRRLIQNSIENPIALEIIGRNFTPGDTIKIDYKGETNAFAFAKGESEVVSSDPASTGAVTPTATDTTTSDPSKNPINQNAAPLDNNLQVTAAQPLYYGQQIPQGGQSAVQSPVAPVTSFDPLSVLAPEVTPVSSSANQDAAPVFEAPPMSTGAYTGSNADTIVNTNNFQQGTANETLNKNVLQGSQLTGSGLDNLSEEF